MDAGSVEKFESMRGDPRYNLLYLFPSRIADFSPVTPAIRGEVGGFSRAGGDGRKKIGKTRLSTLPCIRAGGWKQRSKSFSALRVVA